MSNPNVVDFVKAVHRNIRRLPDDANYIMIDRDGEVKFSREKPIMGESVDVWIRENAEAAYYSSFSFYLNEIGDIPPMIIGRDEYLKILDELRINVQVRFFRNDLLDNGHNTVCCMIKNRADNPKMFDMSVSVVSKDDMFSRKKAWEILSDRHNNGETIEGYRNSSLNMDFNIHIALANHVESFPDETLYSMALKSVTYYIIDDTLGLLS